jgi:hypothetical protein
MKKKVIIVLSVFGTLVLIGIVIVGFFLVRFVADVNESLGSMPQPGTPSIAMSNIDPLDIDSIEQIELYVQGYSLDYEPDNLVATVDNSDQIEQWRMALSECSPHRLNHPSYDEVYLAIVFYEGGKYSYMLRIDSNDNDVDLVPFEMGEAFGTAATFERGVYRCEGLKNFVGDVIR